MRNANFFIPHFNLNFGTDWDSFQTIVDDNVDNLFNKTYQLYWLQDISKMPVIALEKALKLCKIKFTLSNIQAVSGFLL